ncbi:hypothetical protein PRIPAC_78718 [Pristionchus pacificus]|uniref:Uncharacterized protein n=1 Tax=Pristionchus pacificus TaxID=54126 RepID=A0A2A6BVX6_PRIPA|nr:hypothetical protein PRIPAC_78718 [Pristionchus pacificus]|eukprot:PDM69911.1 hypothetical protein PRIPAC_49123 [Pristionchus pacificus]
MDNQPEVSSHAIKDVKKSKEKSTKKQNVLSTPFGSDKSSKNFRLTKCTFEKNTPFPKTTGSGRGRPKGTTKVAALGHTDDFDVAEAPQWAGKEAKRFIAVFAPHHSIFDEEVVVGKRRRTEKVDYGAKRGKKNDATGDRLATMGAEGVNDGTVDMREQERDVVQHTERIQKRHRGAVNDGRGRLPEDATVINQIRLQEDVFATRGPQIVSRVDKKGQKEVQRRLKRRDIVMRPQDDVNDDVEVVRLQEHPILKGTEEVVMRQPEAINDDAEDPERSLVEICNFLADDFPTRYRRKKRRIEVMTID